jgi:2-oxo-4-hydroxy-4-carboxy-5-ureidoimidazoline decarboxylase
MTLDAVNGLDHDGFTAAFGGVYEHSAWVAERTFPFRPFVSRDDLCAKMRRAVEAASRERQLELLREHPDLGTRAKVSASSASEQAGVGLDQLTQPEYDALTRLNERYRAKFGFPFLYAVRGSNKLAIIQALEARCDNDAETEFQEALEQVYRIARLRTEDLVE